MLLNSMDYSWSSATNSGNANRRQLLIPAAIGQLFDRGFSTAPLPKCSRANPWVSNFQFKQPPVAEPKLPLIPQVSDQPVLPLPGTGVKTNFGGRVPNTVDNETIPIAIGHDIVPKEEAIMIIDNFNKENAREAAEDMIIINGESLKSVPTTDIDMTVADEIAKGIDQETSFGDDFIARMMNLLYSMTGSDAPIPEYPSDVLQPEVASSKAITEQTVQTTEAPLNTQEFQPNVFQSLSREEIIRNVRKTLNDVRGVKKKIILRNRNGVIISKSVGDQITPEEAAKITNSITKDTTIEKITLDNPSSGLSFISEGNLHVDRPNWGLRRSERLLEKNRKYQNADQRSKLPRRKNLDDVKPPPQLGPEPVFRGPMDVDVQPHPQLGPDPVFRGPIQGPDLPAPKRKNKFGSEQPNKYSNITDRQAFNKPRRSERIIAQNNKRQTAVTQLSTNNIQATPTEITSVILGTVIQAENPTATPLQVAAAASRIPATNIDPTLVATAAHNYNLRSRKTNKQPKSAPRITRETVRKSNRILERSALVEQAPTSSGVRRSRRLQNIAPELSELPVETGGNKVEKPRRSKRIAEKK